MHSTQNFYESDPVKKIVGYKFDGWVVSAFLTLAGHWRYCVDNGDGLIHIFNGEQLEKDLSRKPKYVK